MVIKLAKPFEDEKIKMQQAQYMPRPTSVAAPQKGPLQAVGEAAGADIVGKVGTKGAEMAMGKLFGPAVTGGAATAPAAAGANIAATAGNVANAATIAGAGGAGAGAAGAAAGFAPMLAAAAPWLAGAAVLGKAFKLFNMGGLVGPLGNLSKVKYKTHGGDVTHEYEINMGPLSKGV